MKGPFGQSFFEWWASLAPVYRYGVGVLVLILGLIVWRSAWGGLCFGGGLVAISVILLVFAGLSQER
jgi:hypothetical protein